ncbi:hypothetical protein LY76DRAFT_333984 [Colletotrichum caudatum]|nr:hypothetical protein LY76DRAFT_333984 [Colletotrichum caudatum]
MNRCWWLAQLRVREGAEWNLRGQVLSSPLHTYQLGRYIPSAPSKTCVHACHAASCAGGTDPFPRCVCVYVCMYVCGCGCLLPPFLLVHMLPMIEIKRPFILLRLFTKVDIWGSETASNSANAH